MKTLIELHTFKSLFGGWGLHTSVIYEVSYQRPSCVLTDRPTIMFLELTLIIKIFLNINKLLRFETVLC